MKLHHVRNHFYRFHEEYVWERLVDTGLIQDVEQELALLNLEDLSDYERFRRMVRFCRHASGIRYSKKEVFSLDNVRSLSDEDLLILEFLTSEYEKLGKQDFVAAYCPANTNPVTFGNIAWAALRPKESRSASMQKHAEKRFGIKVILTKEQASRLSKQDRHRATTVGITLATLAKYGLTV